MVDSKHKEAAETVTEQRGSNEKPSEPEEAVISLSAEYAERELSLTEECFLAAQAEATKLSLGEVHEIIRNGINTHEFDPNFPTHILAKMKEFVDDSNISTELKQDSTRIQEMRLEAAILTTSSPYAEVRATVDNTDDENIPSSTIRSWTIGMFAVFVVAFMNQLFSVRQPSITVHAEVVQLLSYPAGKAFEKFLPDVGFTLFGVRHSLNPGPFSKKEHMLITIMATVGSTLPHTRYIIFTQFLEKYFNQPYSKSFGYQILLAISSDLMGYGLAGICRRILVYPAYCLYPKSLVTIALNKSLHEQHNAPVRGPFKRWFNISRFRFFMYAFIGMFVYFWFPDYVFSALSIFNWIAWIAPTNINLAAITGIKKGLGVNPLPTFDWNIITHAIDPLVIPYTTVINTFAGVIFGGIIIIAFWYTNTFFTGYLPISNSSLWTNNATVFNVSRVLDERGWLDEAKYQAYSPAYMTAASLAYYFFFFALYAATFSHAYMYHRQSIWRGLKNLFKRSKDHDEISDIHEKKMTAYPEVSELWYVVLNVIAIALGIAAITGWETYTTVGVIFMGVLLALVYIIPAGVMLATTGITVELNVIAEFIGGAIQPGNALAMNFFKAYGFVTTSHALNFINDLKLAHYMKIPPRHTFWAQVVATIVSAFVCTAVMNFQLRTIPDICETDQKSRFTCPGVNVYFSAAVQFGSLGARKVFGSGGQYTALLAAFPIGLAVPVVLYYAQRRLPKTHWARRIHPVAFFSGGTIWTPPYNVAYVWPAVPLAWLSMVYFKTRYLAFWSKYNYVLSAAFSIGIALSALVIFFALSWANVEINWWGNSAETGCEAKACTRLKLNDGEYFGARIGTFT